VRAIIFAMKNSRRNSKTNTVKLGYNELGYNELGYNELGYNELGYNEQNEFIWLVLVNLRKVPPSYNEQNLVITNKIWLK